MSPAVVLSSVALVFSVFSLLLSLVRLSSWPVVGFSVGVGCLVGLVYWLVMSAVDWFARWRADRIYAEYINPPL